MTVHIALLRAVNVGGHGKVAMAELRDLFAGLGLADARTLLQTGNVVFRGDGRSGGALEAAIGRAVADRFGLRTEVFVRSAAQWARIVAANPFRAEAAQDPGRLVLMTLGNTPGRPALDALRASIAGRERIHAQGAQLYISYPDGIGRSKLTGAIVESRLDTCGTGRNWNTVLKLAALAGS